MAAVLGGAVAVDGRVPAAGELLDRAHVDHAVVQVFHEAGLAPEPGPGDVEAKEIAKAVEQSSILNK